MKLDMQTLAFILSLTGITQVIAFSIQYRVNSTYRGLGGWLLGSMAMATAFIALALTPVKTIGLISVVGVPLLIGGRIALFVGTLQFFGEKPHKPILCLIFIAFSTVYYYFLFVQVSIAGRTVVGSAGVALFSFLNARVLLANRSRHVAVASNFTAGVFLFSGFQLLFEIGYTLLSRPIHSYQDYALPQIMLFVVPIITSSLWTFGFILMVNQRLAADNREEQENLRRMFNTSPDASSIIRLEDGVLVDVNQGFLTMTGYTRDEVIGQPDGSICRWRDAADRSTFMARMRDPGTCENLEVVSQHKDGSEFIGMVSARIITIHDRPHIICVTRDITGRRRVEREKAELDNQFQQLQKAESLGRMAGAIAHHFNNQLQSVLTNLELMAQLPPGAAPGHFLARAKLATERAAEMSSLMLVYLGRTSLEQRPCDLSALYRSALAALQAKLPETVTLEADFPLPGPMVKANASQIQQVLANLAANALEALNPAQGSIHITLRTLPADALPTSNRVPIHWLPKAAEYASLEVADDGGGIHEADLEKLFDPFFSTRFTGRGLGLSVVLGIVQAHGGAVTLSSSLGRGSAFQVHLPLCDPGQAGSENVSLS